MIYFDYAVQTFYDDAIHRELPESVVAIDEAQHTVLLDALNRGAKIKADLSVLERPSLSHEWDSDSQTWLVNPQLKAEQQSQMWARIKQKRHDNLRSGVYIQSVGKWLHNDDDSRAQYTFMRTMATLPENMLWKTMDNRFIPMTRELLDELSMQLLLDEQADFANAERHRAAMLQADNPLDYDYSSGWTATFQD